MKAEREREGGVKRAEAKGEGSRGDSVRESLVQSPTKIQSNHIVLYFPLNQDTCGVGMREN